MASQNSETQGKKRLIVNAFVEMCKSWRQSLSPLTKHLISFIFFNLPCPFVDK